MADRSAKDLILRPIPATESLRFIRRHHYSGKAAVNATTHIGVFMGTRLEGAMQFGPPLDKAKMVGLVDGTGWGNLLELNRLAFTERLPRNSESRALAIAFRLLRRHAPQVKWVVSFADATQCGDGTIYRAAGFVLTGIKASRNLARFPNGDVVHKITCENMGTRARPEAGGRSYYDITGGVYAWEKYVEALGGTIIPGHQLRYIKFLDPTWADRLTVPVIPFADIPDAVRMYRGTRQQDAPGDG